jgi:predicted NBD/HSP70 family sugar kinase
MYIGVDVGGSNIRVASFEALDNPHISGIVRIKSLDDYSRDLANIHRAAHDLSATIAGVGMGMPAVLDAERTQTAACTLEDWEGKPLRKDMEKLFGCRVILGNDSSAAALGQAFVGGQGENFLFVIWGTGIGGAFVRHINGHVVVQASEIGHQVIEPGGSRCVCGQSGCLDALCAGRGIEKLFGKPAADLSDQEWLIVEERFARGLLNVIAIQPMRMVVFAGGIALNQPKRLINIRRLLENTLKIQAVPTFQLAEQADLIGVYGALSLLKESAYLLV